MAIGRRFIFVACCVVFCRPFLPPKRKAALALQADKKASFGTIIKVMDALKLAGVKNLPAFTHGEK